MRYSATFERLLRGALRCSATPLNVPFGPITSGNQSRYFEIGALIRFPYTVRMSK